MNKISKYLILLKLALFLSSNLFAKDKPNVLFIFADDQCYKTIASLNNEEIKTGIFPTEAIKPVGAGDSFMAGLLSSLASGYDLKNSVIRGSACASIVVSLPGCAPAMPDEDQLNNFINNSIIKDL